MQEEKAALREEEHVPKRAWMTPRLNVLARRGTEEAVLATCKFAPSGPGGVDNTCHQTIPGGCEPCETVAVS